MRIIVNQNIDGENYRRLVEFAFAHSDAAMTVYQTSGLGSEHDAKIMETRALLSPYLLHSRNNSECTPEHPEFEWPGTRVGYLDPLDPAAVFFHEDMRIYADTYDLTDFVKDYILSVDGFFHWTIRYGNPEDISFFKDGRCWLFTTSHENYLYFLDHTEEVREMLDEMKIEYSVY